MQPPSLSAPNPPDAAYSATEQRPTARIGALLFKNRGWLPVLFLGVPLIVPGRMSALNWLAGLLLIAFGESIRLAGVAAAGTVTRRRSRHVQRLVTYGVFAWVRNPLYVGNLLVWMGFVVISGVIWFLPIALVLFSLEYSLIVRYEEGVLESIFGAEYLAYKQSTPRWIPRRPPPASAVGVAPDPHEWPEAWRSERSTFLQYLVLVAAFVMKQRVLG